MPSKSTSIREFFEIENQKQAFAYMLTCLSNKEQLSIPMIKEFHALLTDRLQHDKDKGKFKSEQNAIRGAEFPAASPQKKPFLMNQWVDNTKYRLETSTNEQDMLETLADTHIQFERIHPFSDGNGRAGRIVLMYLSLLYLDVPIIIRKEWRGQYMEYLGEQDVKSLAELFKESFSFERIRVVQF